MRTAAFVLACAIGMCGSQRVQLASMESPDSSYQALAGLLLAFNPGAAFGSTFPVASTLGSKQVGTTRPFTRAELLRQAGAAGAALFALSGASPVLAYTNNKDGVTDNLKSAMKEVRPILKKGPEYAPKPKAKDVPMKRQTFKDDRDRKAAAVGYPGLDAKKTRGASVVDSNKYLAEEQKLAAAKLSESKAKEVQASDLRAKYLADLRAKK